LGTLAAALGRLDAMGLLQNPPELGAAFFFRLHPNNDPIQFEIAMADNENLSRRIAPAYSAARCGYR
jgi:hypothetical protein